MKTYVKGMVHNGAFRLALLFKYIHDIIFIIDDQQDATFWLIYLYPISSTCFGQCFRPSSGALDCIYSFWYSPPMLLLTGVTDEMELILQTQVTSRWSSITNYTNDAWTDRYQNYSHDILQYSNQTYIKIDIHCLLGYDLVSQRLQFLMFRRHRTRSTHREALTQW